MEINLFKKIETFIVTLRNERNEPITNIELFFV
jgi:hypothetical protein